MTAVGLGQQRSQAVGLGFELCRAKLFYDLSLTFFDTRTYRITKGFTYEIFGTVRQKIFDGIS